MMAIRCADAKTAIVNLEFHPGMAVLYVNGQWLIDDPDLYTPSDVAIPPRCQKLTGVKCGRAAGHAGECVPREWYP